MPFDLTAHMKAMSRTVRNLERDEKPAKAVVASCLYKTDPADLWDALTNPARLPRWFSRVTGDLRQGGRYQIEGNAGGTILECEQPKRVALTWEFMGGMSWVTLTLSPAAGGTKLELEHVAFEDAHWGRFGPGAVGVGWDLSFMGLARHLAEPGEAHPAEAAEGWFASDEAKRLIRTTSDAWGAADIEGGADRTGELDERPGRGRSLGHGRGGGNEHDGDQNGQHADELAHDTTLPVRREGKGPSPTSDSLSGTPRLRSGQFQHSFRRESGREAAPLAVKPYD